MAIINSLQLVEKFLVNDLIQLEKEKKGIFEELFIERTDEVDRFVSFLDLFREKGLNLIITGEAGVGKTHFIANLMISKHLQTNDIYFLEIDYRKLDDESEKGLQLFFIKKMLKFFTTVEEPLNGVSNTYENIILNLQKVFQHFTYCNKNPKKNLVIILDDLDYVEEELWGTITNSFLAYAKSKYSSVIISCRPPLEAALKTDPRTKKFLYNIAQSKHITLPPLSITNILVSRLNYIYKNSNRVTKKIMEYSLKINGGEITSKHIPLGKKHLNFLKMLSNGNVREMTYLFKKNLEYIINNRKKFDRLKDGTINFTREKILELYYDDKNNECCKIININAQMSRKKSCSLYYNLLVAIADREIIDEDMIDLFENDLGLKRKDIVNAIVLLSNNEHRMIYPISIGTEDRKLAIDQKIFRIYRLSSRGRLYIENLCEWEGYIERVGKLENKYNNTIDEANLL